MYDSELAGTGDCGTFSRLRHGLYDIGCGIYHQPTICATKLPRLPTHSFDNAHPRMYQQHADEMACNIQLLRVYFQHHRLVHRAHSHPSIYQSREPRTAEVHACQRGMGEFLPRYRFLEWSCGAHVLRSRHLDDEVWMQCPRIWQAFSY